MADFCHDCVSGVFHVPATDNDFVRPMGQWLPRAGLCEGCGVHLFDHHGRRLCLPGDLPEGVPAPGRGQCRACRGLSDEVNATLSAMWSGPGERYRRARGNVVGRGSAAVERILERLRR